MALTLTGFAIALAVVPATEQLTGLHRRVSGSLLAEEITRGLRGHLAGHAAAAAAALAAGPRQVARRRRSCWFSATGGFVLSMLPVRC